MDATADAADTLAERVRDGYENAEKIVQRRPGESVAAAFAPGWLQAFWWLCWSDRAETIESARLVRRHASEQA